MPNVALNASPHPDVLYVQNALGGGTGMVMAVSLSRSDKNRIPHPSILRLKFIIGLHMQVGNHEEHVTGVIPSQGLGKLLG